MSGASQEASTRPMSQPSTVGPSTSASPNIAKLSGRAPEKQTITWSTRTCAAACACWTAVRMADSVSRIESTSPQRTPRERVTE